jgi:Fe-S oxidoreductase
MVIEIDDLRWDHVNEITGNAGNICFQCGECTAKCPIGQYTENSLNIRKLIRSAQLGIESGDDLWSCATCRLCENTCPRGVGIVDVTLGLRELAFEDRAVPDKISKALWDIFEEGNPWGGKKKERAKWAEGLGIRDAKEGVDVLLYVGCEASYDKRLHNITRSLVSILRSAGIDFGILGNDELCCGEPLINAGETGYMEELANTNIRAFDNTKAKVIVTVSPHCSATFKDSYRKFGLNTKVMHYAEYLHTLFKEGKLSFTKEMNVKLTYHDPCVLSRNEWIVDEPRELLLNIKGVQMKEMKNSGDESICCGGGGNRMFMEFNGPRLADFRTKQAEETGAEILVTACSYCNMNLYDSAKTHNMKMDVRDLAEVLKDVV